MVVRRLVASWCTTTHSCDYHVFGGDSNARSRQAIGAGRTWHKKCFVCSSCKKSLDSSNLQVRCPTKPDYAVAPPPHPTPPNLRQDRDGQLFCNACYTKNFGPKGFRGGAAGGMQHTN